MLRGFIVIFELTFRLIVKIKLLPGFLFETYGDDKNIEACLSFKSRKTSWQAPLASGSRYKSLERRGPPIAPPLEYCFSSRYPI